MVTRTKKKNLEIYLSKKDIKTFFKMSNSSFNYLIKNKKLKPIISGGLILFSLTSILEALSFLLNKHKA
jgi:hypothetical protein